MLNGFILYFFFYKWNEQCNSWVKSAHLSILNIYTCIYKARICEKAVTYIVNILNITCYAFRHKLCIE